MKKIASDVADFWPWLILCGLLLLAYLGVLPEWMTKAWYP